MHLCIPCIMPTSDSFAARGCWTTPDWNVRRGCEVHAPLKLYGACCGPFCISCFLAPLTFTSFSDTLFALCPGTRRRSATSGSVQRPSEIDYRANIAALR